MTARINSATQNTDLGEPPHSLQHDENAEPSTGDGPTTVISGTAPAWTRNLYRRMAFGRKHFFAQDDATQAADYYIMNPVPQKHASQWRPVFYRGDHPKYCAGTSVAVGRAFRTGFWNSFQLQMGDGVHEIRANQKRKSKRKSYARMQKWRRFWRRPEKPPKEPLEEDVPVEGFVTLFKAWRPRFATRTVKWQLGGREYRWTGTRRFMTGPFRKWKGVSHDLKVCTLPTYPHSRHAPSFFPTPPFFGHYFLVCLLN